MGVISHNIGHALIVQWNPLYLILFPKEFYGWVYGSMHMISQTLALVNIPMLAYNTENDDYGLMNYVLAGVCVGMIGPSFAIYRKYKAAETEIKPEEFEEVPQNNKKNEEESCEF